MRGEFAGVKSEIFKDIFAPLMAEMSEEEFLDEDLWGDLFREAIPRLQKAAIEQTHFAKPVWLSQFTSAIRHI